MNHKRNILPYMSAIIMSVIFGFSFLFSKKALMLYDPFTLLSLRFMIAFLVFSILIFCRILKVNYKGKPLKALFFLGLMQPVTYFVFETYGIKYASSSEAGLMIALIPIVVCLLAAYFLKEKPTLLQSIFIVISVAGVSLIVLMNGGNTEGGNILGILLLCGAVISGAVFNIISRKISIHFSPIELTYFMMMFGAIFFNIISISSHIYQGNLKEYFNPLGDKNFVVSIIYLGIFSSIVAFLLINYTLSKIEASRSAVFANLTTVVSIFAGVVIMKERFEYYHALGSIMILLGVWGTNYFGNRRGKSDNNLIMTKV